MVNSKGGFLVQDDKEVDEDQRIRERQRERERAVANLEPRACHSLQVSRSNPLRPGELNSYISRQQPESKVQ